jgi:hypothetical protein
MTTPCKLYSKNQLNIQKGMITYTDYQLGPRNTFQNKISKQEPKDTFRSRYYKYNAKGSERKDNLYSIFLNKDMAKCHLFYTAYINIRMALNNFDMFNRKTSTIHCLLKMHMELYHSWDSIYYS